jgi:hypothetical protein
MEICPICGAEIVPLPKTGDADGFDCPVHQSFKVAGTVFGTRTAISRREWEDALQKAKARAKAGKYPLIRDGDFL